MRIAVKIVTTAAVAFALAGCPAAQPDVALPTNTAGVPVGPSIEVAEPQEVTVAFLEQIDYGRYSAANIPAANSALPASLQGFGPLEFWSINAVGDKRDWPTIIVDTAAGKPVAFEVDRPRFRATCSMPGKWVLADLHLLGSQVADANNNAVRRRGDVFKVTIDGQSVDCIATG